MMTRKGLAKSALVFFVGLLSFGGDHLSIAGAQGLPNNIRWTATAILLDGIDAREKYFIPVKEAVEFVAEHSRFKVHVFGEASDLPHTYSYYDCAEGLQTCVVVNKEDLDASIWESVKTRDFYILLWETGANPPLQAGGTWGAAFGVLKGGLLRPYITIPVDPLWYHNEPFEGFDSRAAQIVTHEIVNAINAKLEVEPYNCHPLVPDPAAATAVEYEASRLAMLTEECYRKYVEVNR